MPHIEAFIKTQRIMCMKKYLDSYNSTWKIFLDSYLADFGGSFLLKCNYDVRFLPKTLPKFYNECLSEWADYQKLSVVILPDVLRQIIWNNKFICINGRPLFKRKVLKKGFLTVHDIVSDEGKLKSWSTLQNNNLTGVEYFVLMSVFNAIPVEWKTLLKDTSNDLSRNNESHDNTLPTSSKEVYWDLVRKIEKPLVSKLKYEHLFPTHDLPWKDIYLLPRSVTLDSKMGEFQYKVLSRILYTNKVLHKMGIVNSPACTFCHVSDESLEHLFLHCPISSVFWLSVTEWLKSFFTTMDLLTSCNRMFGLFRKDMPLLNLIILLRKQVIYQSRHLNIKPSLSLLKTKLKNAYQLELLIAKQNNSLDIHNAKWKAMLPFISFFCL